MSEQPPYGTERFTLARADSSGHPYAIRREVLTEAAPSQFYDEASQDFVTWRAAWVLVETVGFFDSREAARDFMVARSNGVAA